MKKILSLIMTFILIFVFAACSNPKQNAQGENQAGSDVTQNGGYMDNEMCIYSYKADTFCPIISLNNANLQMLNIVFEGLVKPDRSMTPVPCLAESWSVSGEGLEWRFNLRTGVKWHNGESFTARDVVYTVNQIKNNPSSIYFYNTALVESVTEQGQSGVVFKLTEPNPNFASLMYFPIIKYSDTDVERDTFRPNGTGAYKLEDRNEGNTYYLVRNDSWWGGKATTDEIKVKLLPDKETSFYAFTSGNIDMTVVDDLSITKTINSGTTAFVDIPTPIYSFIGINHNCRVLSMNEVREAISYATDRNKIVDDIMMKRAVAADAPVRSEWFVSGGQTYDFGRNTKLAHEKLIENGWEMSETRYHKEVDGVEYNLKFDILINDDNPVRTNIAQTIEKSLEEVGMEITVTSVPYETYIERINSGAYDAFIGSYTMPADINIRMMFGKNVAFGFYDEELNTSIAELKVKTSQDEIVQAYSKIISRFNKVKPVIGLMFENHTMVHNNSILGTVTPSYYGVYEGIESISVKGDDN